MVTITKKTPTQTEGMTIEEYLNHEDGTGARYELINGELVVMAPPSWLHFLIADYLAMVFKQEIARLGQSWIALQGTGQQTTENSARLPDIAIVPLANIYSALDRSAVLQEAAILVVEVVSESTALQDYREKVTEYQTKGICEYWVVDPDPFGAAKYVGSPKLPTVSVYQLVEGIYQIQKFQGDAIIVSATFPELNITADQILRANQ
jgi:Uma2 family endonuclease